MADNYKKGVIRTTQLDSDGAQMVLSMTPTEEGFALELAVEAEQAGEFETPEQTIVVNSAMFDFCTAHLHDLVALAATLRAAAEAEEEEPE